MALRPSGGSELIGEQIGGGFWQSAATAAGDRSANERGEMLIVGGWFEVDPAERDAFITERSEVILRSRAEHGCIEYVIAADPVDPGRAVLFERWASQADLDVHLAALASAPKSDDVEIAPTAVSIVVYDVSGERTLA
jgi:quinol monooxygenase YgiN